jgi:hypothetical protein
MTKGRSVHEDYEKVQEILDVSRSEAQNWDAERLPTSIPPGSSKLTTRAGEAVQDNFDSRMTALSQGWSVYLSLADLKELPLLSEVIVEE